MDELALHTKALIRITCFFLAFCLLLWIVLPEYRSLILGVIAGTSVSAFNSIHLAIRTRMFTEAALEGKRKHTGFAVRAAMSVLVVLAAYKLEQIDVISTIVSLFAVHLIFTGIGIVLLHKRK
ncbi:MULTISPECIES: ATP synthase subunit I [unclassified Paenibacillus]|uniref:ATP synthase subunit I n=1 Tax=unclassified Paenibacillus TaxID=185978 RepID=UPI001C0FD947|nr:MULTISPECIES: ATP synthase subunit I [unclassified Paenibacillus]MBU5441720.1 ATP synthase subunit I [Paenibacillus sp. MSJ-34]CAH0118087.1 hypothetical protein PAE9249_00552 [Paenibacillus sp. CECT 9249]